MSNKFAQALKPTSPAPAPIDEVKTTTSTPRSNSVHDRPSRKATKHIGGYFDPVVSKQLRHIALEEDSSVQALLAEAIDMLFQSRRKPTIAAKAQK